MNTDQVHMAGIISGIAICIVIIGLIAYDIYLTRKIRKFRKRDK